LFCSKKLINKKKEEDISKEVLNQPLSSIESIEEVISSLPLTLDMSICLFEKLLSELYNDVVSYQENFINYREMKKSEKYEIICREVCRFRQVDIQQIQYHKIIPFFVNIYNFMYLHSCILSKPNNYEDRNRIMEKEFYMIGKYKISMKDIETYILRGKEPEFHKQYFKRFKIKEFDPRFNFILSNGGKLIYKNSKILTTSKSL
jgi:hypothetical protein